MDSRLRGNDGKWVGSGQSLPSLKGRGWGVGSPGAKRRRRDDSFRDTIGIFANLAVREAQPLPAQAFKKPGSLFIVTAGIEVL